MGKTYVLIPEGERIEPGAPKECGFEGLGPSLEQFVHAEKTRFDLNLYVIGWIEYADELGVVRRTAFARQYIGDLFRFLPIQDDPDYESVD
jgi:hypothetical protein